MVPASLMRTLDACNKRGVYDYVIPEVYTFGKGHVSFFYDKRRYLENRYSALMKELRRRGYVLDPYRTVSFHHHDEVPPPIEVWEPDEDDVALNLQRIMLRVSQRPTWYRYKKRPVTFDWYKNALTKRGLLDD
jgi:hypothetical protein